MTIKKAVIFYVFNYIRAEQMLRAVSLYIAVNETQFKTTHIDCECTHAFCSTYTYPT